MNERPNKRYENPENSAVPAVELARDMLCDLSGPRGWNDTRESWLSRGARRVGLSLRRARAIFYQEPIRLTADEYLAIEQAYATAHAAVATFSALAGDADLRRRVRESGEAAGGPAPGGPDDRDERAATDAVVRPAEG